MIDKNKIRGIIFDYGGTLDTGGDHWSEVILAAYRKAGVNVDKNIFRDAYIFAERELARTKLIVPEHNFRDLLLIKMRIEFEWLVQHGVIAREIALSKAEEVALICYESAKNKVEEAKPVLELLSSMYPLALVSNFYGNVESVLKDFELLKYFSKVIESAVVGIQKPDPRIFEVGIEALGLTPEETVVVGDSFRKDIEPAEKLGCQVIWIKGKCWSEEEDAQTHPNIVMSLNDIIPLLNIS